MNVSCLIIGLFITIELYIILISLGSCVLLFISAIIHVINFKNKAKNSEKIVKKW